MEILTHFSTFSGIEGIGIAAEMAGFMSIGQVEINPFSLKILNKRYPDVPKWNNIKHLSRKRVIKRLYKEGLLYDRNDPINLLSGGFPCQDLSVAGKQAGLEGERSGLWFEMLRVISELRPRWVLAENVRGAVNLALDTVKMGLEGEGYKVWPYVIPASAFGAPHRRERLFVVGCREDVVDAVCGRWGQTGIDGMGREMEEWGNPSDMSSKIENAGACSGMMWRTPLATDGEKSGHGNLPHQVKMWPTPQARDFRSGDNPDSPRQQRKTEQGWSQNLNDAVKLWPTPKATLRGDCPYERERRSPDLHAAVKLWPTPKSRDFKSPRGVAGDNRDNPDLNVMAYNAEMKPQEGQLNPDWVECLMGFPIGWTNPDVNELEPWPGWPAPMGMKEWRTPIASDSSNRKLFVNSRGEPMLSGQVKLWRTPDAHCDRGSYTEEKMKSRIDRGMPIKLNDQVRHLTEAGQFPYEPPRIAKGIKNRADRIKALGNAVVPWQVLPLISAIYYIESHLA